MSIFQEGHDRYCTKLNKQHITCMSKREPGGVHMIKHQIKFDKVKTTIFYVVKSNKTCMS